MRVTILAIAGGAPRHLREEEAQKNTWASKSEEIFDIYWVHGTSEFTETKLLSNRQLFVPASEVYSNLLAKRIHSLMWAISKSSSEYYVLTNCSGYIDLPTLSELISRLPKSNVYTGPAGNGFTQGSELDEIGRYYVGGGFIIISADVASLLCNLNPNDFIETSDDLAIGTWLLKNNIFPSPLQFCNLSYGDQLSRNAYTRIRHLTHPEVTIRRMYELHDFYENGSYSVFNKMREVWRLWNEALPHQFSLRRAIYELRVLRSRTL